MTLVISSLDFASANSVTAYDLRNNARVTFTVGEDDDAEVQNSANFDASKATLGIRQKSAGRFKLKVRIPKVKGKVVKVTVKVADEFTQHVKVKSKVFKAKRGRSRLSFFITVKKSINDIIPTGSLVDVPITLTDLQNGAEEQFILEIRD